jgi:creatinine amidohydrolase
MLRAMSDHALPAADVSTRVLDWRLLTGRHFAALDPARCVVTATLSPLEVHGPHLPVATDNAEADELMRRTVLRLAERYPDRTFLRMPPLIVAADVLPQRGSVMFRSSTVVRVVEDLGRSLAAQGFRDIWLSNFHGGPRHFVPLEHACDRVNRRHGARMVSAFSLLITRLTDGHTDLSGILGHLPGLSVETLAGDSHGGVIETSMMLHLFGDAVGAEYRTLPTRTVDLWLAERGAPAPPADGPLGRIRHFVNLLKYFADNTYTGAPWAADAAHGSAIFDVLAEHSADALAELLDGRRTPAECRSPLWKLRHLFVDDRLGALLERLVGFKQRVF